MRVILVGAILALAALGSAEAAASHAVRTYVKKDGTVVAAHRQTNPNRTQRDNWSAKGNVNPITGRVGTKEPTR